MGSKIRRAYTVMGDAVNLGSRLEGNHQKLRSRHHRPLTRPEKAVTGIVFRELDRVRVKGKDEPIAIFEPIGKEGDVPKAKIDELKLWQQTLKAYRGRQWDQAELQLLNLQRMSPETKLYKYFGERIISLRSTPPDENWGGVTNFTEK